MNKKYIFISFLSTITMILLLIVLFFFISNIYMTMVSIFILILVAFIINYDNKQKEKYKLYYLPLYHYIKTYYDILSQPYERISMGTKHQMMSSIAKDLINFLNSNLKYASEEMSDLLSIQLFYRYENEKIPNEFQDIYNINQLIPLITKELLENYSVLHINYYLKKKRYLTKKFHMINGIIYLYVDSFLLDIARKKNYVLSLYECVEFYKILDKYRDKNYKDYYKIYRYIKKNRNKDINFLIKQLNHKFNIKINKIKRKKKRDKN